MFFLVSNSWFIVLDNVLKKWKDIAEQLLNGNNENINDAEQTRHDSSMIINKNIGSKSDFYKNIAIPPKTNIVTNNRLFEKTTPKQTIGFSTIKSFDENIKSKSSDQIMITSSREFAVSTSNKFQAKNSPKYLSSLTTVKSLHRDLNTKGSSSVDTISMNSNQVSLSTGDNNQDDTLITSNIISHDNKEGIKENTTKKDESTSASKTSPSVHQHLSTSTGIRCKDKPVDSRLEMRGTNYWTLYNYIPADEVKKYFLRLLKPH